MKQIKKKSVKKILINRCINCHKEINETKIIGIVQVCPHCGKYSSDKGLIVDLKDL